MRARAHVESSCVRCIYPPTRQGAGSTPNVDSFTLANWRVGGLSPELIWVTARSKDGTKCQQEKNIYSGERNWLRGRVELWSIRGEESSMNEGCFASYLAAVFKCLQLLYYAICDRRLFSTTDSECPSPICIALVTMKTHKRKDSR